MNRRLTFHIGLEKTGTDSFQRFCTEQQLMLAAHATLYPTASLAFGGYSHEPLVACYLDYRDFSIRSSGRTRAAVLGSLTAEIERTEATHVLVSAEHFSSRFKENDIERLAADFAGFDCRIAVVVREHRARLFSAYAQAVLSGRAMTLDAYCDEVLDPASRYMRYAATIGAWETVFGRDKVDVFGHQSGQDIIPLLCASLVDRDMKLAPTHAYWDNLSIGPRPTERLRRVNAGIRRIPGTSTPAARRALRRPLRGLARLFAATSAESGKEGWRLSGQNAERLAEIAETDNAWLERHYGVRLVGKAGEPIKANA